MAVLPCRRRLQTELVGWYVGRLVDRVERLEALGGGVTESSEGVVGSSGTLLLSVVRLFHTLFHIMLFCSEFTSEEFSSPRTLWFSCLGVRELWMFRESSSLAGAFIGSSSLFWELGSSYPGWRGEEHKAQSEP